MTLFILGFLLGMTLGCFAGAIMVVIAESRRQKTAQRPPVSSE